MGWDIDRFPEGEVNLELICCICTCILEDPVESPCRHVFCSQCIKTWLSNQKSCPHCRAAVHKRDLQSVVPLLKNIISKQRIFCDNKQRGCEEVVPLESLQSHVAICQYGLISCANDGCSVKIMRKDMKSHSDICSKRTVLCEEGCEMFLKLGDRSSHNCVQALRAHFQGKDRCGVSQEKDAQNEMLGRISKLEELVNMLVAGKNGNNRAGGGGVGGGNENTTTTRSSNTEASETYNCAPFSIPSPHGYERQPPPYTVFPEANDVNSTINLAEYSLEQNDLSDSVASLDSDNEDNNSSHDQQQQTRGNEFPVRSRSRNNLDQPERPMSPVYEHLERPDSSSQRFYFGHDGRLLTRETRQRSRSPHPRRSLRVRNTDRGNRHNRTYDRDSRRDLDDDEPLVLRIGVSQTVSDSSTSSTSTSGSDTD